MTSVTGASITPGTHSRPSPVVFCILTALVLLAYTPALTQPLLEDDYPNIVQAHVYGPVSGWAPMFHDPVFRVRTTFWLLMNCLYQLFGMHAAAYYAAMILLHVVNTWLVYGMGVWRALGYELTAWAAGFFAIYEGHQEAVMWVSASSEPLMLMFGLLSLLAWLRFIENPRPLLYLASLAAFCFALLSKESSVIFVPLFVLTLAFDRRHVRPNFAYLLPFGALAFIAGLSIILTRSYSFRFQDGSFSLHAPFWLIWPDNFARLLWFWGLLCLIAISIWKPPDHRRIVGIGGGWMAIALIPYSFLTYSVHIPSRQLYLASVGLCIIVGFALQSLYRRCWPRRRGVVIAVCAVVVSANVIYLWTKKRAQYLERAAPTEQLIALARRTGGPIYIQCFPRPPFVAESAIQLMTGRAASDLIWNPGEAASRPTAATFCYKGR
jgi:hypothetical protein